MPNVFKTIDDFFMYADSPSNLEDLGRELAIQYRDSAPSHVLTLNDAIDSILGHIVARELGISRSAMVFDLGRLSTDVEMPENSSVLIMALFPESQGAVSAIETFMDGRRLSAIVLTLRSVAPDVGSETDLSIQRVSDRNAETTR